MKRSGNIVSNKFCFKHHFEALVKKATKNLGSLLADSRIKDLTM